MTRRRRHVRTALALLGLLAPAAIVAGTAAPSYASSSVCGTALADLLGQDCTAPEADIYRARADDGYDDLMEDPETTSDDVRVFIRTKAADPDGNQVTFSCRLTRGATVVQDWEDCTDDAVTTTSTQAFGRFDESGLVPGAYTLSVKATDAAVDKLVLGSAAPNEQADPGTQLSWTVVEAVADTTPPNTYLTRRAKRWHLSEFGDWGYRGSEPLRDAVCRLQGRTFTRSCDGHEASVMSLVAGDLTFTVAGTDHAGNTDPTPAVNRFTVPVPSRKLRARGGWSKGTAFGYFFSGYSTTKKKGATLSAARAGTRAVALVATRCRGCGSVKVTYGGKVLKKVSLAASSRRKRQLIPIGSWAARHGGRFSVVVTSSGKPVTIEGLGFSKRR